MPKVTIWVKETDYPIFQAIPDRPEWLHTVIQAAAVQLQGGGDGK